MKIVVIGGTGLIGTKLVARLRQKGHEVVAASPASGVNTITGEGLAEALAGTQIVVDLANSPSFEDDAVLKFFETSGRNLLAAEAAAGVRHHVALSVVGSDRLPDSGYLRAKMAQERLIKASGIPYTIVRSTQFFEFVSGIAQSAHRRANGSPVARPAAADHVRRRGRRHGRRHARRAGQRHHRDRRTGQGAARRTRPALSPRQAGSAHCHRRHPRALLRHRA